MALLDWLLRPRGKPLPAGEYEADFKAVYSPAGAEGPVTFRVEAYDADMESLGRYVFEVSSTSRFSIGGRPAQLSEVLDYDLSWLRVRVDQPGILATLEVDPEVSQHG